MNKRQNKEKRKRLGPKAQKILILLQAGITISLTTRPDVAVNVIKGVFKDLEKIDHRTLNNAIANLYRSKLIDYKENPDKTVTLNLTDNGKIKALQYNPDAISIKKMDKWDGMWRLVMFDIPERFKKGRNALSLKLKQMGFYPMQKSAFISPYECKNEVDFVVELFNLKLYVRFILVKETDIDLDLKNKFQLP